MKNKLSLLLIALACIVVSCSKDDDDDDNGSSNLTNTSKLCNKNWKLISIKQSGVELISLLDTCERDNLTRFNTDSTYTDDEGPSKCDPADPQTLSGTWTWADNETKLVLDSTDTSTVLSLTPSRLKLSLADTTIGIFELTFGL